MIGDITAGFTTSEAIVTSSIGVPQCFFSSCEWGPSYCLLNFLLPNPERLTFPISNHSQNGRFGAEHLRIPVQDYARTNDVSQSAHRSHRVLRLEKNLNPSHIGCGGSSKYRALFFFLKCLSFYAQFTLHKKRERIHGANIFY